MYCPEPEYRTGFTRCADCDVELVVTKTGAVRQRHVEVAADTGPYDLLLWKGSDPDFYLSLLGTLNTFGVERLGRATNPPVRKEFAGGLEDSFEEPEFGIWISERSGFLGRWILNSELETKAEEDAFLKLGERNHEGDEDAAKRTGFVCVLCLAEYSSAIVECPNCGVPLRPAEGFSEFDGSAYSLSSLAHPQFTDALCSELQRAGIPFNNSRLIGGDILSGRRHVPASNVSVLSSDQDRAKQIFANVLRYWQFDEGLAPASREDPTEAYWPDRAERNRWLPEDLTAEAWAGTSLYKLYGVASALREFEIPYSVTVEEPLRAKILVHPDDEAQARDVAREVLEGQAERRMDASW